MNNTSSLDIASDSAIESTVTTALDAVPPPTDALCPPVPDAPDTSADAVTDTVIDADTATTATNSTLEANNRKAQARQTAKKLLDKLFEAYPAVFPAPGKGKPVPLAIGIHKELLPVIKEWGFDYLSLRMAMAWYTRQLRYQRVIAASSHRVKLSGEQAEEITEENKQLALQKVSEINALRALKEPAPAPRHPRTERTEAAQRPRPARKPSAQRPPRASTDNNLGRERATPHAHHAKKPAPKPNRVAASVDSTPASTPNMAEKLAALADKFKRH